MSGVGDRHASALDPDVGPFDPVDVERIARSLTSARRNMMRHSDLGYGDCDHSMDGPGRRMMYALADMGLLRRVNFLKDPHSSASYVTTRLGAEVRRMIIDKGLK